MGPPRPEEGRWNRVPLRFGALVLGQLAHSIEEDFRPPGGIVSTVNGIVHPLWSLRSGGYTPGTATAPFLLVLAIRLALELRRHRPATPGSLHPA